MRINHKIIMKNREMIKQLKKLRSIKPSMEYREENKAKLMELMRKNRGDEIIETRGLSKDKKIWYNLGRNLFSKALKPIGVFLLILTFIVGSGIGISFASQESLPGDIFYSVKLTIEQAEISLKTKDEDKVKLEVEFAGRRLVELNKVKTKVVANEQDKSKKAKVALDNYKKNIETVHKRLEEIKKKEFTKETVDLVTMVEEKTLEYANNLKEEQAKEKILEKEDENVQEGMDIVNKEAEKSIKEAVNLSEDASIKAVDIILEKHKNGEIVVDEKEIAKKVESKLDTMKSKLEDLKEKAISMVEINKDNKNEDSLPENADVCSLGKECKKSDKVNASEGISASEITKNENKSTSTDSLILEVKDSDKLNLNSNVIQEAVDQKISEINTNVSEAGQLLEKGEIINAFDRIKEINELAKNIENQIEIAEEKKSNLKEKDLNTKIEDKKEDKEAGSKSNNEQKNASASINTNDEKGTTTLEILPENIATTTKNTEIKK